MDGNCTKESSSSKGETNTTKVGNEKPKSKKTNHFYAKGMRSSQPAKYKNKHKRLFKVFKNDENTSKQLVKLIKVAKANEQSWRAIINSSEEESEGGLEEGMETNVPIA